MMSVLSVEAVTEFIRLFREHSCLWMVKSNDYLNRNKRNEAYDVLVKFCRTIGFPSANREFVTKKIQNLRGAFRKEFNKVTESRRSGAHDVYQPSLWYYDLLLFIEDQELPSVSGAKQDKVEEETRESIAPPARQVTSQQHTRYVTPPKSDHILVEVPVRGTKRKFKSNADSQTLMHKRLMSVCTEALKNKRELTEHEALSITIAKKLEKMSSIQALHAETIIQSVLRRGILNKLTETTDVCDNQCSKAVTATSNPGQSLPTECAVSCHSPLQLKLETPDDPLSD